MVGTHIRKTCVSAEFGFGPINPYSRGFVCVIASSEHVLHLHVHDFYGTEGNRTHRACTCAHRSAVLQCSPARFNGNVFHERFLLWMCESGWEADKLQRPAKCHSHGGRKWL